MKIVIITLLVTLAIKVSGQSFNDYKDSVNHFSIYIPVGWKYGLSKTQPTIKLIAYNVTTAQTDSLRFNYNINIIETPHTTLNDTYLNLLKYLSEVDNFKVIDSGQMVINNKDFKWLIESHKNVNAQVQMLNYDFISYQNDKTYVLTMVTFSKNFEYILETFWKIANSLRLTE
jgi:hypothetical protein